MSEILERSQQRKELAIAQANWQEASDYLGRVQMARKEKADEIVKLYVLMEECEAAVATARQREGSRLVAEALGQKVDEPSVDECTAGLVEIQQEIKSARTARDVLENEQKNAEQKVDLAARRRTSTLQAVVIAEGSGVILRQAYVDALAKEQALRFALEELSFALPVDYHGQPVFIAGMPPVDQTLANQLRAYVKELEQNADAAVPSCCDWCTSAGIEGGSVDAEAENVETTVPLLQPALRDGN